MTNEAVAAILDYLCTETRNSMHAILGCMELADDAQADPAQRAAAAAGRASADQLLGSIDDIHELTANAPPAPVTFEKLDLVLCAGEIIEALNLASGKRRRKITLDASPEAVSITQDRKAVEQVLTRVLGTAMKLARGAEVYVTLAECEENGIRLAINTRDADLSARLVHRLNSSLEQVSLQDPDDIPFGVAVMVAGKRLRAMGGTVDEIEDAAGHRSVALDVPSRAPRIDAEPGLLHGEARPDALHVLVAEDCDESFFLIELILQYDQVHRARDGSEALRLLQKQRFDIVLMDIHMPDMDGYAAIRGIRDWETETGNARTPLVVLSSDDLGTQHRWAAESGCSGFLRKPLRRDDLQGLMDRLRQSRRLVA
jgi:CheY-like chemotaxis protein